MTYRTCPNMVYPLYVKNNLEFPLDPNFDVESENYLNFIARTHLNFHFTTFRHTLYVECFMHAMHSDPRQRSPTQPTTANWARNARPNTPTARTARMPHAGRHKQSANGCCGRQTTVDSVPPWHRAAVPFEPRCAAEAAAAALLVTKHLPETYGSVLGQLQAWQRAQSERIGM